MGEQKSASRSQAGAASSLLPLLPLAGCSCMKGKPQIPKCASSGAMDAISILLSASLGFYFFSPLFPWFRATKFNKPRGAAPALSPFALQYFSPKIAVGLEKGRAAPSPRKFSQQELQESSQRWLGGEQSGLGTHTHIINNPSLPTQGWRC